MQAEWFGSWLRTHLTTCEVVPFIWKYPSFGLNWLHELVFKPFLTDFIRLKIKLSFLCAGFFPRSISQRYPRLPHERHHVPRLRALPAVLQGSLGLTPSSLGDLHTPADGHWTLCPDMILDLGPEMWTSECWWSVRAPESSTWWQRPQCYMLT